MRQARLYGGRGYIARHELYLLERDSAACCLPATTTTSRTRRVGPFAYTSTACSNALTDAAEAIREYLCECPRSLKKLKY